MEISPINLEGQHVRLDPLSLAHEESLIAAAADGELWTSTGAYSFRGITQRNVIEAWTAAGGVARECDR